MMSLLKYSDSKEPEEEERYSSVNTGDTPEKEEPGQALGVGDTYLVEEEEHIAAEGMVDDNHCTLVVAPEDCCNHNPG